MNTVTNYAAKITGFFKIGDKRGVSAIEYGLIAALISLVIITAAGSVGSNLTQLFTNIASKLPTAVAAKGS